MNALAHAVALTLAARYDYDTYYRALVDTSPEPYRAMVYESGLFDAADEFDGSDEYHALVDEIEGIMNPPWLQTTESETV